MNRAILAARVAEVQSGALLVVGFWTGQWWWGIAGLVLFVLGGDLRSRAEAV